MFRKMKERFKKMLNKYTSISANKSLQDLLRDYDKIKEQFEENYLPQPEIMSDGRVFIRTVKKTTVINLASQTSIAGWIILDKDYNPLRQSEYEFAELPEEGYLIKLRATRPYQADTCNIDYLIKIESVRLNQSCEDLQTIHLVFMNEDFPMKFHRTSTQDTKSIPMIDIKKLWEEFVYPKVNIA